MFHIPSFIRSFFILLVLFAILFIATKLSPAVKTNVSKVLGTEISQKTPELPENLQKDVTSSLDTVKKQGMEANANDIVDASSKVNKVITDYHNLQKEIEKQINEFFRKKDNN